MKNKEIIYVRSGFQDGELYFDIDRDIYTQENGEWLIDEIKRRIHNIQKYNSKYKNNKYVVNLFREEDGKYNVEVKIYTDGKVKVITMKNRVLKIKMDGGD
ncbi:MAG: hypothetical protein QXV17_11600 [Candidatus Micrarchaeaceae archaeon]